jgi:predicted Co/Zn/Cd cation transporter (cation efflux family)
MKLKKTISVLSLLIAANLMPTKKAEACIFIISPMAAVIGISAAAATMVPYLFDYEGMSRSNYDNYVDELFFTVFSFSMLDQDLNRLEAGLAGAFPSMPPYIIKEASKLLRKKSENVAFNQSGIKSVYLTSEEFVEIEMVIPKNTNQKETEAFKRILTSPELGK